MSNVFYACRGSVVQVTGAKANGYSIDPFMTGTTESPVLLSGISLNTNDIISPLVTLDGYKILYSFGKGFGDVRIILTVLLGAYASGFGNGLKAVIEYFNTYRISSTDKPVKVSLGENIAYSAYLTGLAVGEVDPKFNIQHIIIGGITVDSTK
jgi:hypothetical protein